VEEKLNEFFDMELIHENEPLPDQLSTGNDFTLPESINITPDEPRTSITPEKSIHTGSNESRFIEQTLPFSLLMSKIVKTPAKKRKHSEDRPPSGSSTPSSAKRSKVT
jgi:hypothetical protein